MSLTRASRHPRADARQVLRASVLLALGLAGCGGGSGGGADDPPWPSPEPRRNEIHEVSWEPGRTFDNPYDPDQVELQGVFTTPAGGTEIVDGFWYQGYTRRLDGGREVLTRRGAPTWKVRFTPRLAGTYGYHLVLADHVRGDTLRWPTEGEATFTAQEATRKGFLRVSAADPSYLEHDDGSFFLGIGHNLCGWEWPGVQQHASGFSGWPWVGDDNAGGTYDDDRWLRRLAANGANTTQFDLAEGDQLEWTPASGELPFSADWAGLGRYNQQTAWKLDRRVAAAERRGIAFRLSLLHWEDFDDETGGFPDWGWARNPYQRAQGGPVDDVSGFFTSADAQRAFRKTLRYVNARWGASASLLAYELWNEADNAMVWGAGKSADSARPAVRQWHEDMAAYLKSIDIYQHLVTSSFAWLGYDDALWTSSAMDVMDGHQYSYYLSGDPAQYDTVGAISAFSAWRRGVARKPFFFGEFALSPGGDVQRVHDRTGVEFHKQLWASIMAGDAITAMHWTWGSYLDADDLYHHYAPLSAFLAGADLRGLTPFDQTTTHLRVLGLGSPTRAYAWAVDPGWDFRSVEGGAAPIDLGGSLVPIDFLDPGTYAIRFFDPQTGAELGTTTAASLAGTAPRMSVVLPSCRRDVAFEIRPGTGSP